jgi:hypothetical protein
MFLISQPFATSLDGFPLEAYLFMHRGAKPSLFCFGVVNVKKDWALRVQGESADDPLT